MEEFHNAITVCGTATQISRFNVTIYPGLIRGHKRGAFSLNPEKFTGLWNSILDEVNKNMLKKHGWKKSSEFDVIGKKTFFTLIQISTVAYGPLNLSDTRLGQEKLVH